MIEKEFEEVAKVLIAMEGETAKIAENYGKQSRLYKQKSAQLEKLKAFYDIMVDQITFYQEILMVMAATNEACRMLVFKSEMVLTHEQLARLMGYKNLQQWKDIDTLDAKLKIIAEQITKNT